MIESQEQTIGAHEYRVSQLPAGKARRLLVHLFRVCGPAVGRVVGDMDGAKSVADVDMVTIGEGLRTLSGQLSEQDVERVFDAVFGSGTVEVQNSEGTWKRLTKEAAEGHFAGLVHEQFMVVWFALKVNYAGFLGVFGGSLSGGSGTRQAL